jgi:hypothetical protein
LKQGLKQKLYPLSKAFQDMWHATCTHIIHGDSQFLMVGNQIDTLTRGLYFGHNLCCKYSNGSCEFILNIYILKKI